MSLPFQSLKNLSDIADSLMGENSTFPGPSRPILSNIRSNIDYDRNNLSILGGYMNKLYFNLLRILPFIGRLGDLMERESLINNEKDRKDLEKMAKNVGMAFAELNKATEPIPYLLENLCVGKNIGECQISENNSSN